jgi:LmbE family N-acetylglucosaminyl deacetylase
VKVLFLAPHGDEAHIGAAGTIVRLQKESNAEVYLIAFSSADKSLPKGYRPGRVYGELRDACAEISIPEDHVVLHRFETRLFPDERQKILQTLVDWQRDHHAAAVFAPSPTDLHQDHATVALEAARAFRKSCSVYGYDLPWNVPATGSPLGLFVELTEEHLATKMRALAHFKSQQGKANNCATPEYARGLAVVRGNQIETPYAEAFEVVREVRKVGDGVF